MKDDVYHRPITEHGGSKYVRVIHGLRGTPNAGTPLSVDVYKVLTSFGVTCPAVQQAVKKLLCAGLRGKGSRVQDLKEAMDALFRAIEDAEQDERFRTSSARDGLDVEVVGFDGRRIAAVDHRGDSVVTDGQEVS